MKKNISGNPHVVLLFFGLYLLCGCGKKAPSFIDVKEWLLECPLFVSPVKEPVLAQAGDVKVTASDYREWALGHSTSTASITWNAVDRRRLLSQLLSHKMSAHLAGKSGVRLDPVSRQIAEGVEYSFLMAAFSKQIPVADIEAQAYYQLHLKELDAHAIVVSHVLVKSLAPARTARTLLQTKRTFTGLLKDTYMPPDRAHMDPDVANVIFALKPGQVSDPVKTMDGFEVFRRDLSSSTVTPSFESMKEQIRNIVAQQKLNDRIQQEFAKTPVTIDENLLNSIDLSSTTIAAPVR